MHTNSYCKRERETPKKWREENLTSFKQQQKKLNIIIRIFQNEEMNERAKKERERD